MDECHLFIISANKAFQRAYECPSGGSVGRYIEGVRSVYAQVNEWLTSNPLTLQSIGSGDDSPAEYSPSASTCTSGSRERDECTSPPSELNLGGASAAPVKYNSTGGIKNSCSSNNKRYSLQMSFDEEGGGGDSAPAPRHSGNGDSSAAATSRVVDGGAKGAAKTCEVLLTPPLPVTTPTSSQVAAAVAAAAARRDAAATGSRLTTMTDPRVQELPEAEKELLRGLLLTQESLDHSLDWTMVVGLQDVRSAVRECIQLPILAPDLFTGIRKPPRAMLLAGPPGNGKTTAAKAIASSFKGTFLMVTPSKLISKWFGETERNVETLFSLARKLAPTLIFFDEVDAMLTSRTTGEHEASRRVKNQFLTELDGVSTGDHHSTVLFLGATNRAQDIDEAVSRRFGKVMQVPHPDEGHRLLFLKDRFHGIEHSLTAADMDRVARSTESYSYSDLQNLCREAAMASVRDADRTSDIVAGNIRAVSLDDLMLALSVVKPSSVVAAKSAAAKAKTPATSKPAEKPKAPSAVQSNQPTPPSQPRSGAAAAPPGSGAGADDGGKTGKMKREEAARAAAASASASAASSPRGSVSSGVAGAQTPRPSGYKHRTVSLRC
eukprot:GHVU01000717.1.p1 GENE.GHVU01000717.1~~GHVU01000717.1.p1  ORF type:complete len:606 (-),score=102.83 GHVU01000717.1:237-2054(-)